MDTILFFHMNQLGDLMFSLPVLAGARSCWPGKRLVSVARPEHVSLIKATGLADEVISRPRGSFKDTWKLMMRLRREKASAALLFSESPQVLILAAGAGISRRVGFAGASLRFLMTETVVRTGVPSLRNNTNLAVKAGISTVPPDYTGLLRVPEKDLGTARQWLASHSINPAQMLVAAPGASKRRTEKCWPRDRWAGLLSRSIKNGLSPVLIGAPSEKNDLEQLSKTVDLSVPVYCSSDGILSLAALFKYARLFAGIDSGATHLAAAVGLPVVALYGPTDPSQIGPQPLSKHCIIKKTGMNDISVEEVWAGIAQQLGH